MLLYKNKNGLSSLLNLCNNFFLWLYWNGHEHINIFLIAITNISIYSPSGIVCLYDNLFFYFCKTYILSWTVGTCYTQGSPEVPVSWYLCLILLFLFIYTLGNINSKTNLNFLIQTIVFVTMPWWCVNGHINMGSCEGQRSTLESVISFPFAWWQWLNSGFLVWAVSAFMIHLTGSTDDPS